MQSRAEIDKLLKDTAEKAKQVSERNQAFRNAAGVGEPSEAPRAVNIIPPNVSPVIQNKR